MTFPTLRFSKAKVNPLWRKITLNCQVAKQWREFLRVRSPSVKRQGMGESGECHKRGQGKKTDKIAVNPSRPVGARAAAETN